MKSRAWSKYFHSWILAVRPRTLTASATPVLIGTALASQDASIDWLLFSLALAGAVLIQVGTNLADEYTDHRRRGGAVKFPAPHKVIQRGLLSEKAVLWGTIISFALSTGTGLYIVSQVGWPILVVGVFSSFAGYLHSSGPFPLGNWALGELTVFVFMGPLIVMASYYVQVQGLSWSLFWSSFPIGLLVTAILQCNNLRDMEEDRKQGKHTWVTIVGVATGRWIYALLLVGAYLALVIAAITGVMPRLALIALASAPWALLLLRRLWQAQTRPDFSAVLVGTAKLHLWTGLLIALGVSLNGAINT